MFGNGHINIEGAFGKLKEAISKTPVLRYFDILNEETSLQCDASRTGLGASLLQRGQPVDYASRASTPTEQHFAQIEKELLAVEFGMERFNQYTYGRKVFVERDHKPHEIIHKKGLTSAPDLQRMFLRLHKYDLEITYKRGKNVCGRRTVKGASQATNQRTVHRGSLQSI